MKVEGQEVEVFDVLFGCFFVGKPDVLFGCFFVGKPDFLNFYF